MCTEREREREKRHKEEGEEKRKRRKKKEKTRRERCLYVFSSRQLLKKDIKVTGWNGIS